jgi:thioredoxin-related protein
MNKTLLLLAGLLAGQLTVLADVQWSTDLPASQAAAKKDKKLVLVNFTGSDWCSWCKKLQKEVFTTKEFDEYSKKKLVLVEIDFPNQKKQSPDLKKANEALQSKYKAEGFPTIVVLNGEGKELWRQVGYMPGGPAAWIAKLDSLK